MVIVPCSLCELHYKKPEHHLGSIRQQQCSLVECLKKPYLFFRYIFVKVRYKLNYELNYLLTFPSKATLTNGTYWHVICCCIFTSFQPMTFCIMISYIAIYKKETFFWLELNSKSNCKNCKLRVLGMFIKK